MNPSSMIRAVTAALIWQRRPRLAKLKLEGFAQAGFVGAIVSLALVTAAAVVIVAAPGYFAADVPAALALQD